jgi:hypothetical protein
VCVIYKIGLGDIYCSIKRDFDGADWGGFSDSGTFWSIVSRGNPLFQSLDAQVMIRDIIRRFCNLIRSVVMQAVPTGLASAITPVPTGLASAITPVPTGLASAITPVPTGLASAITPVPTGLASAITPVRSITLYCYVFGSLDDLFPVDIEVDKTVGHLRNAIFERVAFKDVKANQLALWQVSSCFELELRCAHLQQVRVPMLIRPARELPERIGPICASLSDHAVSLDEPTDTISTLFPEDISQEHLYIVVQVGAGEWFL